MGLGGREQPVQSSVAGKCPRGMPEELTEDRCAGGRAEDDGEVRRSQYQVLKTLLGFGLRSKTDGRPECLSRGVTQSDCIWKESLLLLSCEHMGKGTEELSEEGVTITCDTRYWFLHFPKFIHQREGHWVT